MNMGQHLRTWEGALKENRFHRIAVPLLVVANMLLVIAVLVKDSTVVLVPPQLDQRMEISGKSASPPVFTSWGVYYATLFGNVTPANADFIGKAVAPGLAPGIYRKVLDSIAQQVDQIKTEQITLSFQANDTRFDAGTRTVYVIGELVSRGIRGTEQRELRTYEMQFSVFNHSVRLDDIKVHKGTPTDESQG